MISHFLVTVQLHLILELIFTARLHISGSVLLMVLKIYSGSGYCYSSWGKVTESLSSGSFFILFSTTTHFHFIRMVKMKNRIFSVFPEEHTKFSNSVTVDIG